MGLTLDRIVPWGRSLAEYTRMFHLTVEDYQGTILDCGGGPASFNAELTGQGYRVVSCDPVYQFSTEQIRQRIDATYPEIMAGVQANLDAYHWREIASPEQLGQVRLAAMEQFLVDFPIGLAAGRYRPESLPHLPFADQTFDLALCSHLLFTYSDHLGWEFHWAAIQEMLRVARQVRVFPLVKISGEPSPWLPPILDQLKVEGYTATIATVDYEFQRGGNQLLQIIPS